MEFRLHYRGRLKGNAKATEKQLIRQCFHEQLKHLWDVAPLSHHKNLIDGGETIDPPRFLRSLGEYTFIPIVNERMALLAELDILMLRPEAPGSVLTQSGDIDNRLKTLFDGLRMPKTIQEMGQLSPVEGSGPFHCLLEDDALITKVSVETDRLLEPTSDPLEVILVARVRVRHSKPHMDNLDLGL